MKNIALHIFDGRGQLNKCRRVILTKITTVNLFLRLDFLKNVR